MSNFYRLSLAILLIYVLLMMLNSPYTITNKAYTTGWLTLEATFTEVANGWEKVERLKDNDTNFTREDYPPDGRGDQDGQRLTFFAHKQPLANQFLLYYAPKWQTNSKPIPILLVHGANDNVDRAWAKPNEYGLGCLNCPDKGLMQFLVDMGYKVFAINFPHKQGNNFYWAQQIYAAIARIKGVTGAKQVDIIAHSKGAFAARMYVSGLKPDNGADYANDVRKLVLIGSPNQGIDYAFRHGAVFNALLFPDCGGQIKINGPSPHISVRCGDQWQQYPQYSIYTTSAGNFFPGQKQMLKRWDKVFALSEMDIDWQTTYYGGKGTTGESLGIQTAMEQGSLVDKLVAAHIPDTITTYLLAGTSATIPFFHNEHTGPNDGLLFTASATSTDGIGKVGEVKILEKINHLQLIWYTDALTTINEWLGQ